MASAAEAAEAWLEQNGAEPQAAFVILLAIEELVTNCIKYAWDDAGEHTVVLVLAAEAQSVRLTVIDDGRAFDPLDAPPPNLSTDVRERPIGGLGLHMLREMADEIVYKRRDGTNRVTLTKRTAPKPC
jgi:anti-sigma regulatory factor (Ser/Thr protein kinase)